MNKIEYSPKVHAKRKYNGAIQFVTEELIR